MITVEDVRDLAPGDVVELANDEYPDVKVVGPLREGVGNSLILGDFTVIRYDDGTPSNAQRRSLRVVKKAKRLYANSKRREPAQGDVVRLSGPRPAYSDNLTWWFDGERWFSLNQFPPKPIVGGMPPGVILLIDGVTGKAPE